MPTDASPRICAIDIETTGLRVPSVGLGSTDEILQLAIVAEDHSVVFNELFRPEHVTSWRDAEQCNGISFASVQSKPLFSEQREVIQNLLDRYDLYVIYNADFDLAFLKNQGISLDRKNYFCMMQAFSRLMAKQRSGRSPAKNTRWYSLKQCARYFNVPILGKPHDATTDAMTVLMCYQALIKQLDKSNTNERL